MNRLSSEHAEEIAQNLMRAAGIIGATINQIENMARLNAQTIRDNPEAYETAVLSGRDVATAFNTLAMSFDRAALIKFMPED